MSHVNKFLRANERIDGGESQVLLNLITQPLKKPSYLIGYFTVGYLANERRNGGESQASSTLSLNLPNTLFFSLAERFFLGGALSRFYSFSILAKGPDLFDLRLLSKPGRFLYF